MDDKITETSVSTVIDTAIRSSFNLNILAIIILLTAGGMILCSINPWTNSLGAVTKDRMALAIIREYGIFIRATTASGLTNDLSDEYVRFANPYPITKNDILITYDVNADTLFTMPPISRVHVFIIVVIMIAR
ncbi:MAG: hypothetical protein QXF17_06250, partial [Ignisphaera sp.]